MKKFLLGIAVLFGLFTPVFATPVEILEPTEFGVEAEAIINILTTTDKVTGRYHLRRRVERFYTRSCKV